MKKYDWFKISLDIIYLILITAIYIIGKEPFQVILVILGLVILILDIIHVKINKQNN